MNKMCKGKYDGIDRNTKYSKKETGASKHVWFANAKGDGD